MQHPQKKVFRQKRPYRLLLLSAALLLAAVLLYVLPTALQPEEQSTEAADSHADHETDGVQTLQHIDSQQLAAISVSNAHGSYTLCYRDNTLMLQNGNDFAAIDSRYAAEWLSVACHHTVQGTVFNAPPEDEVLSAMGLLQPKAAAEVHLQDGTAFTLSLGNAAPETTYAYGQYSCFSGVYLLDSGIVDLLQLPADRLMPVENIRLYSELVTQIERQQGDEVLRITFSRPNGQPVGTMHSPYHYPLSESSTTALLNTVSSFFLGSALGGVTDDTAAEYGFDAPLATLAIHAAGGTVAGKTEDGTIGSVTVAPTTLTLTIGQVYNEFYYTARYQGQYYLLSRLVLKPLVETPAEQLLSRQPANMRPQTVHSVTVETADEKHHLVILRTEQLDESGSLTLDDSGQIVYDYRAALNDTEIAYDLAENLIDLLADFTVGARVTAVPDAAPALSVTLETFEGETRILRFIPMDVFFDAVSLDGTCLFTCESDFTERILHTLQP